jgi:hypothetical protein
MTHEELAEAQFNLGNAYANGRGVAQDDAQAEEWNRKAADQGYAKAQSNVLTTMRLTGWQRLSAVAMTVWTVLVGVIVWVVKEDISTALLFWLTPPLLVFLDIWATRWIYRGFRGD